MSLAMTKSPQVATNGDINMAIDSMGRRRMRRRRGLPWPASWIDRASKASNACAGCGGVRVGREAPAARGPIAGSPLAARSAALIP